MKKAKKIYGFLMAACILCTSAAIPTASAAVPEKYQGDIIKPFASEDIFSIIYAVNSSRYSSTITFTGKRSGSVLMKLQRKVGGYWNDVNSKSASFTDVYITTVSKDYNITTSGTYRISIAITISGVTTTRQSGEFSI